jgi:hypothetical protein
MQIALYAMADDGDEVILIPSTVLDTPLLGR